MRIKIWGCRGTLPSPGAHTVRYGGNTTCVEIRDQHNFCTVIDAGSGLRILGKQMLKDDDCTEICLMLTHAHWDHLMGFPFFIPAYLSKYKINVCGVASARQYLRNILARQLEAPYFPVDFSQLKAQFNFGCNVPGNKLCHRLQIDSIPLSHPNGGYGYKFTENGKSFVFLTDNELGHIHEGGKQFEDYVEFCKGAEILLHDAQYTDKEYEKTITWGHSTYRQTLRLATEAGVKRLGLIHHDPDRTDDEIDEIVAKLKKQIESDCSNIDIFAGSDGLELTL